VPLTSARPTPLTRDRPPAAVRPAVLYRCTSFFDIDGTWHEQVFDWDILASTRDAYKKMRKAAVGVTQALSASADQVLRSWLTSSSTVPVLERTLQGGGVYELELAGSGSRIVLSLRPVLLLPLLHRPNGVCPALMLRGRRLWSQARPNEYPTEQPAAGGESIR
jgi:hypothetical protein